jgi:hypothetical protein
MRRKPANRMFGMVNKDLSRQRLINRFTSGAPKSEPAGKLHFLHLLSSGVILNCVRWIRHVRSLLSWAGSLVVLVRRVELVYRFNKEAVR